MSARRRVATLIAAGAVLGAGAVGPRVLADAPSNEAPPENVAVAGEVFVDYDRDGRIDAGERGVPVAAGMSVSIRSNSSDVITTTEIDGTFAADVEMLPGELARVVLDLPDGFQTTFVQPLGDEPLDAGPTVRYVDRAELSSPIIFGIVPDGACPDDPDATSAPTGRTPEGNPDSVTGKVWATCYVEGSRMALAGAQDVLVGANFDASGWSPAADANGFGGNLDVEHLGTKGELGSVWGLAYDEWDGRLYSSAVIKRHADLGPEGVDGLYWVDTATVGAEPVWGALSLDELSPADAPSFGQDPSACPSSTDGFSLEQTVPGGQWDCRDIVVGAEDFRSHDWWAFDRTGRAGIGDIDITPDGNTLLVMNATADAVFVYDITETTPTYVRHHDITNPECSDGEFEAWAISALDGATAYIGATCTASVSQNAADLRGIVIALDIEVGVQAVVGEIRLDAARGSGWSERPGPLGGAFQPWLAATGGNPAMFPAVEDAAAIVFSESNEAWVYSNGWDYHQALLSDIEVDPVDGSLVLAVTDRWAMMTGVFGCDLDPDTSGCRYSFPAPPVADYDGVPGDDAVAAYSSGIIGYNAGDLLRMCNTGSITTPTFVPEGDDDCDPSEFSPSFDPQYGGGPAGATEWYWNDQAFEFEGTDNPHPEAAQGAAYIADRGTDVVYTAMNPVDTFGAGLSWDRNADGSTSQAFQFFRTDLDNRDGTGFKSAALGDVEGCSVPLEVATHVWFDADADGVRSDEAPIESMSVALIERNTQRVVATALTDEHGRAVFGTDDGVLPFTDYAFEYAATSDTASDRISFDVSDLRATLPNADNGRFDSGVIDNRLEFTTAGPGENDHGLDAGFGRSSALPDAAPLDQAELPEQNADGTIGAAEPTDAPNVVRILLLLVAALFVFSIIAAIALRWSWSRD